MVMLLYRMVQSTLGYESYDALTRHTRVMAASSYLAFKIAAKPLQIET